MVSVENSILVSTVVFIVRDKILWQGSYIVEWWHFPDISLTHKIICWITYHSYLYTFDFFNGILSYQIEKLHPLMGIYGQLPTFYTSTYVCFINDIVSSLVAGRPIIAWRDIFIHQWKTLWILWGITTSTEYYCLDIGMR